MGDVDIINGNGLRAGHHKSSQDNLYGYRMEMLHQLLRPLLKSNAAARRALLCAVAHIAMEWADTAVGVKLSFLQRRYMTALQGRDRATFNWNFIVWALGSVFSGWSQLMKDFFRMEFALLWHRALLDHLLHGCFERRGFLRVHFGNDLDNADQRIVGASRELVNQVMNFAVILNGSVSSVSQYSRILWNIRPALLPALALNGALGVFIAIRKFARWLYQTTESETKMAGDIRRSIVRADLRAEDIALCGSEALELRYVDEQVEEWFRARWESLLATRAREAWNVIYGQGLHAIPLLFVASAYLKNEVDWGAISQAIQAFRTVHSCTTGIISGRLFLLTGMSLNLSRVHAMLDACSAEADAFPEHAPLLSVDGKQDVIVTCEEVDVAVGEEAPLTIGLSLCIHEHEALLVVGQSGAGKTSFLRTLVGLWSPARGRISCGVTRQSIMFLPQKSLMAPRGTLLQQVLYPQLEAAAAKTAAAIPRETITCALQAVQNAGLAPVVERLLSAVSPPLPVKQGVDVWESLSLDQFINLGTDKWVEQLSPGEQQRVAFARVFAQRPKLVVLDEATSALDLSSEAELYGKLRQMGSTMVSVAHRPSLLSFHTHVLHLGPGASESVGGWNFCTVEEYKQTCSLQQAEMQLTL